MRLGSAQVVDKDAALDGVVRQQPDEYHSGKGRGGGEKKIFFLSLSAVGEEGIKKKSTRSFFSSVGMTSHDAATPWPCSLEEAGSALHNPYIPSQYKWSMLDWYMHFCLSQQMSYPNSSVTPPDVVPGRSELSLDEHDPDDIAMPRLEKLAGEDTPGEVDGNTRGRKKLRCAHPNCNRVYKTKDGVRKHARKEHAEFAERCKGQPHLLATCVDDVVASDQEDAVKCVEERESADDESCLLSYFDFEGAFADDASSE